ncbi:PEBP-like protein [Hymenopellis radicata]|nr:PEBP-like protein [Hymenopellis radicata]
MLRGAATVGRRRPTGKGKAALSIPKPQGLRAGTPKWTRPLPLGVLPAYDEALKLIHRDAAKLKSEAVAARKEINKAVKALPKLAVEERKEKEQELEQLRQKHRIIAVQSQVNLPDVRWACQRGLYDMGNVAHRHLREQKWCGEGKLDLLMERIHQLKIIPDVLPDLRPTVDVTLTIRPRPSVDDYRPVSIEPGSFVTPKTTRRPPQVRATPFHTDTRLYTMLLVDSDVPDEVNETYTTYLHWMCPNVPLNAFNRGPIKGLNTHTTYVQPHPPQGTKYHRYTLLLLPQPAISDYSLNTEGEAGYKKVTSRHLDIPVVPKDQRKGFDVRAFAKQWELNGRNGGGAHIWRAVWDSSVDAFYKSLGEVPRDTDHPSGSTRT